MYTAMMCSPKWAQRCPIADPPHIHPIYTRTARVSSHLCPTLRGTQARDLTNAPRTTARSPQNHLYMVSLFSRPSYTRTFYSIKRDLVASRFNNDRARASPAVIAAHELAISRREARTTSRARRELRGARSFYATTRSSLWCSAYQISIVVHRSRTHSIAAATRAVYI